MMRANEGMRAMANVPFLVRRTVDRLLRPDGSSGSNTTRTRWPRAAWAALGLTVLAACAGPAKGPPLEEVVLAPQPRPDWVSQPLSWDKLESIEAWLETSASRYEPELVTEAKLTLCEGRLEFSRRDVDRSTTPKESVRVRVEAAIAGFDEVLASAHASPGQRTRAQIGQAKARALLGVPAATELVILDRDQWGARSARSDRMTPLRGAWSRITVHHSAEQSSDPAGSSYRAAVETVRRIQKFHMENQGWGDIGYHFLIDSAGRIFQGRKMRWQGAHAGGRDGSNNYQNVGVCLLGDLRKQGPTPAARKSLELLLDELVDQHRIPRSRISGHMEFTDTECPGPFVTRWIEDYRRGRLRP